jgi:hypothetical protein
MEYEMPSIRGKLLDVLVARRMVGGWVAKMTENVKKAVETLLKSQTMRFFNSFST